MSDMFRFGIFIFVLTLVISVMLYSGEKKAIEKLNIAETDILVFENLNSPDAISFETTMPPLEIIKILNASIYKKQNLKNEGLEIYYCFVENINNFIVENGKKINLQISYDGNISTVGFPLILTGY